MKEKFSHNQSEIKGCFALSGGPCHNCGGGWPGTKSTGKELTLAALKGHLLPERMGCGPLEDQVRNFLENNNLTLDDLEELLQSRTVPF